MTTEKKFIITWAIIAIGIGSFDIYAFFKTNDNVTRIVLLMILVGLAWIGHLNFKQVRSTDSAKDRLAHDMAKKYGVKKKNVIIVDRTAYVLFPHTRNAYKINLVTLDRKRIQI